MSLGKGMNNTTEDDLLQEAFNVFDKDGNGSISKNEVGTVARALGLNPSDKEIVELLNTYDTNDTNTIEFQEFKQLYTELKKNHKNDEAAIANAFKMFDRDGNGYIEVKDLQEILGGCDQNLTVEELKQMVAVVDKNNDGKIDIKEFTKFICKPFK